MSEISKEFALSQVYTNHSLRATTVHVLDATNIAGRWSVTGHKSESSLKTYTGYTSNKTKKTMSSIVSDSLRSSIPATNRTADVKREVEDLNNNNVTDLPDFQLNINHLDLVPLASSQIDLFDAIVTDFDNGTAFDNIACNMDISTPSTVSVRCF